MLHITHSLTNVTIISCRPFHFLSFSIFNKADKIKIIAIFYLQLFLFLLMWYSDEKSNFLSFIPCAETGAEVGPI